MWTCVICTFMTLMVCRWMYRKATRKPLKPGTVVLITGGSAGIGRETVLRFARAHCQIVAWDINDSAFPDLQAEVKSNGVQCVCFKCDVSSEKEVEECTKKTLLAVTKVDIVVCNAGIAQKRHFLSMSAKEFRATFDTNFFGCANVVRSFLTSPSPPSHIVAISSVLAFSTANYVSEYSASKHALHAFLNVLRLEAKEAGLQVNFTEICPWHVSTQLFRGCGVRWGLLKPLSPQYVADSLFEAVCHRDAMAVLPSYQWHLFTLLEQFPTSVREWAVLFLVLPPPDSARKSVS